MSSHYIWKDEGWILTETVTAYIALHATRSPAGMQDLFFCHSI